MKITNTIIIALLIGVAVFFMQQCRYNAEIGKQVAASVKMHRDTITQLRDANGIMHSRIQDDIIEHGTFQILYEDSVQKLAELLQIKSKQIEGLEHVAAQKRTSYSMPVNWNGIKSGSFSYSSPYIKLSGTIDSEKLAITDTISVSVDITPFWQRKNKLFGIRYGKIQHFVDVSSPDPDVAITNIGRVTIKAKEPGRFGVGPYVGIDVAGKPSVGISLHYSLIRF